MTQASTFTVRDEFGLACPSCGSDDRLRVRLTTMADLTPDGTDPFDDHEWDDKSFMSCRACGFHGVVAQFQIDRDRSVQVPTEVPIPQLTTKGPSMTTSDVTEAAIAANLSALADGLQRAGTLADTAHKAMAEGYRNLAIGTVLPLEQELPTMTGLLTAILALHRRAGQGGAP